MGLQELTNNNYIAKLKAQLSSDAAKYTSKDFITQIFADWINTKDMIKNETVKSTENSNHIGLGSQASTKVHYTIIKKYDFRNYIKKYGKQTLIDAMNDPSASYYKKFFKPIVNGFMNIDESWTDTYD